MRNWAVAVEHFKRLTTEFPANTEVKLELQRSLDRLEESRTGKYDLPRIYRDAFKLKKHYLDVADYIGPVEVVDIPGKGRQWFQLLAPLPLATKLNAMCNAIL